MRNFLSWLYNMIMTAMENRQNAQDLIREQNREPGALDAFRDELKGIWSRLTTPAIQNLDDLREAVNSYNDQLETRGNKYHFFGRLLNALGLVKFLGARFKVHALENKKDAAAYLKKLVEHHKNPQSSKINPLELVGDRLPLLESGQLGKLFKKYKALGGNTHFNEYQTMAEQRLRFAQTLADMATQLKAKISEMENMVNSANEALGNNTNMDLINNVVTLVTQKQAETKKMFITAKEVLKTIAKGGAEDKTLTTAGENLTSIGRSKAKIDDLKKQVDLIALKARLRANPVVQAANTVTSDVKKAGLKVWGFFKSKEKQKPLVVIKAPKSGSSTGPTRRAARRA